METHTPQSCTEREERGGREGGREREVNLELTSLEILEVEFFKLCAYVFSVLEAETIFSAVSVHHSNPALASSNLQHSKRNNC